MPSKKIMCCLFDQLLSCLHLLSEVSADFTAKLEHFELELKPYNFQFLSPFLEPGLLCPDREVPTDHQRPHLM